jgi:hypothetical protein
MRYKLSKTIIPVEKPKKPYIPSKAEMDVYQKLEMEPLVEIYVYEHECTDYITDPHARTYKKINVKSVTIQGRPFHLTPGVNKIPLSVRNILEDSRDRVRNANNKDYIKPGANGYLIKTTYDSEYNQQMINAIGAMAENARDEQEKQKAKQKESEQDS